MGKFLHNETQSSEPDLKPRIKKIVKKKHLVLKKLLKIKKLKTIFSKQNDLQNRTKSEHLEDDEMDIEEEKETKKQALLPSLSKFWRTAYELPALYTGGKIIFAIKKKQVLCIANFAISVYDIEKKIYLPQIEHENEELSNFALNSLENILATFTKNFLLRFMDYQKMEIIKTLKVNEDSFAIEMTFDPAGRFLALGTPHGNLRVYDAKKGIQTHEFKGNLSSLKYLGFHPQFQRYQLLSISEEGILKIYDLITNQCVKTNNTNISFSCIDLSEDGSHIYCYENFKVYVYDFKNLEFLRTYSTSEDFFSICHLKIYENPFLLAGGEEGALNFLSLADSDSFSKEKIHKNPNIMKIFNLKTKNQIAVLTNEQNILIYEISLQENKISLIQRDTIIGFNDEIIDLKFPKHCRNKDEKKDLVIMATNSNILKIFNKKERKYCLLEAHSDIVLSIDFIDDLLISSSKDKTIKLWKYSDKKKIFQPIAVYEGHLEAIGCVAIAPKTKSFLISGSSDKSIKVWSIKHAIKTFHKQKKLEKQKTAIKISNALRNIYAHEKDINALKFSPNEKFFASASQDKTIKIWDSANFSNKMILKGHKRGVWDISFSPVEKIMVSASGDRTIKLWNLADGTCLNTLEGHTSSVLKVNWLCFGVEIISAGADGLIKLWNYKKGLCLNTFEKHEGKIWALDVSEPLENGRQEIVSGGNDSLFCLWEDITLDEEKKIQKEAHDIIIDQQNMNNAIRNKDYYEAARIAFKNGLVRNFERTLDLIFREREFKSEIIYLEMETGINPNQNEEIIEFENKFQSFLKEIIDLDINRLLLFIRDMNSSSKFCKIAQRILHYLLKIIPIDQFIKMKKKNIMAKSLKQKNIKGSESQKQSFDEILEILIAYSEKHITRTQNYIKKSFYLDFMLKKINLFNFEDFEDQKK